MSTVEIMDRIQTKYNQVEMFLVLDKDGHKLNNDPKEEDKGKGQQNNFNSNFTEVPRLVSKATSVARDLNPLNELSFLQITYSGYEFLIAPDDDLCVFAAVKQPKPGDR